MGLIYDKVSITYRYGLIWSSTAAVLLVVNPITVIIIVFALITQKWISLQAQW